MTEPELLAVEAEIHEDTPYFFQRIGEVTFESHHAGTDAHNTARRWQRECIATAPDHGVVAAAGDNAIFVARIDQLISSCSKGADEEAVALADPSKICAARIEACYASVHVSSNGLLLAVCEASRIRTWAIRDLLGGDQENHLCEWMLGNGETVKQFSWRPGQSSAEPAEAAVVTDTGRLLNVMLGGQLASDREGHLGTVSCAAWSPDGVLLAFASDNRVIVAAADGSGNFRATAKLPEAEEDGLRVVVSTMAWAGLDALVLSCSLYSNDDDDLEESCSVCMLHWSSWQPGGGRGPTGLELIAMSEVNADPDGQPAGHYHQTLISPWGVAVAAHGQANDNHIIVLEALPKQAPRLLEILDDSLAIRIPLAADYTDNFVTGLGTVLTSTEGVHHPDPEHGKLPPQPVLVVATSDGALRLFTFATLKRSAGSTTHAAYSYDDAANPVLLQAAPEDTSDTTATVEAEEQQSSVQPLSTNDSAAVSRQEFVNTSLPKDAPSQEVSYFHSDTPSHDSGEEAASDLYGRETSTEQVDRAELAASKAAAAALPDSSSDYDNEGSTGSSAGNSAEESSREHAPPATSAELPVKQPQLASIAQAAGRAAATALPDSDEEAEEDLESQASVSIAPAAPPHARAPAQRFGQADRGAATSQAAESAAPGRRLGRLDSLSASDAESVEVQSRPDNAEVPAPQPAKEAKPASMPWSLGSSATAFGQVAAPSSSNAAPAAAPATPTPSLFGTTAPSLAQAPHTSKAEAASPASGAAFAMARRRSGALPAPAFGRPFTAPARQASGVLPPFSPPVSRPAQAPQVPRQSAAQQAIARAREEALAAKAGKAVAGTPASGPPETPAACTRVAPSEPLPPKARLQEEGKELASMECEFLKSLAETRAIEAKLAAEVKAAEGADSRNPGTRKGAQALQEQVQALIDRGGSLRAQLASDRARFTTLHRGWKDDRARAEALLFFNGKRDFLDEDEAVYASEDVDPVIQELVAPVQEQLPLLQKQAAQLSDGIEALRARAQQGYQNGPLAVQQLYNALNLQKDVALSQAARVQRLWKKMQKLGLSDSQANTFDPLLQLHTHGTPTKTKEGIRSPYVRVSRSPWSQSIGSRSPLLAPGSSSVLASKSPWAGDSAAATRALLLEKVSNQEGGIRLTRLQQANKVVSTPAPRTTEKNPAWPREKVPTLSTLQLYEDSERPRSPTSPGGEQHGKQLRLPTLGSHGQIRSSVPHQRPSILSERKESPAHPNLVAAPSSAQQRAFLHDGRTASPAPVEKAAKVSRLRHHTRSSASSPGAAESSQPTSVMPGNADSSASKNTPDTLGTSAKPVSNQSSQSAAKMPPVPSKAALAAAHARSAAALSSMDTRAKQAAPVSQTTASKPAEAGAPLASAAPARKAAAMPPVPSKAAVAAAQAQGQAMLSGQKAKAAPAKIPPVPSKAALAAAQAQGQAALSANKHKAAEQEVSSAPQINFLSVGSGAASSSGQAAPASFSLAPSASPAAPVLGAPSSSAPFASLSFGAATGAPSSFQLASSITAPLPGSAGGAFNFSKAAMATPAAPAPMASAMSVQQPAAPSTALPSAPLAFPGLSAGSSSQTASSSAAALSAALSMSEASKPAESSAAGFGAFGVLGQQASATPVPASSPFGKGLPFGLSAAPAPGTTGAPSFGIAPSAASPAAPSTFGGVLAASTPASPFPAFGQQATGSPAAPSAFGGFGQGTSAAAPGSGLFGPCTSATASATLPFGGFGAPTGFGQSSPQAGPSQGFGGFGQAASIAPGFSTPAMPGFGQAASPAFGAAATPGFGSPGAPAFGAPASQAAPFGAPASPNAFAGGFAAAASQSGGFGSLAQGSNAFGAAAQQSSGGFGAFGSGQPQSGGFGAFGGAAAPSAPKIPSAQGGSMWAPRK